MCKIWSYLQNLRHDLTDGSRRIHAPLVHYSPTNSKENRATNASIIGALCEQILGHLAYNLKGEFEQKRAKKICLTSKRTLRILELKSLILPIFLQLVLQLALHSHLFPGQFRHRILAAHAQDSLGKCKGSFMSYHFTTF